MQTISLKRNGNKLEILNCNFKGKLKKGAHYIDGILHEKESVRVESCSFESVNKDEAVNMEIIPESLSLELNSKASLNPMLNKFWKVIFGALLIIALFSLIILKLNDNMVLIKKKYKFKFFKN